MAAVKMTKNDPAMLQDVRVEVIHKPRRHTHGPVELAMERHMMPKVSSRSDNFVYVNNGYAGSLNSISDNRYTHTMQPPTSVVREQYWACSKWPFAQRILAIIVGILMGLVIGLVVMVIIRGREGTDLVAGILRSAPD